MSAGTNGEAVSGGATTSTLPAFAFLSECVRNVAASASAVDLKHGLTCGLKAAVECLGSLSTSGPGKREKAQVATISAHNYANGGDIISTCVARVRGL